VTVTPVAVLSLAGADVAAGPSADGSWPALMALDGASVKWGRADVLAQPAPATATVALFDPSGSWAAGRDLIGQPLTLRWTVGAESRVYFRGRVAAVTVTRRKASGPAVGTVTGATVQLSATSVLTDLGNRRPTDPTTAWPPETFAARRARLATQAVGVLTGITTRPLWDAAPLAAVDNPGAGKVLEHVTGLFDSAGADRYTFDPHSQELTWVGRRTFPAAGAAHLVRDATRPGVYVTGPTVQRSATDPAEPAVSIPAGVVEYSGGVSKTMGSRITRVTLTYPGTGKGFTVLTPGADETAIGVRSLDVATQHTDDTQALTAANDLSALVTGEASGWVLDTMRWDTTKTDGFDTIEQARLLLAGCERTGVFWLSGSWLPGLGVLPLFGVMGGSIVCSRGAWRVEWNAAPTSLTGTAPGVTWDDLDPSLVWSDDPTRTDRFDDSVTYDDLAFVASPTITNGA
jgi:hypothetical protein